MRHHLLTTLFGVALKHVTVHADTSFLLLSPLSTSASRASIAFQTTTTPLSHSDRQLSSYSSCSQINIKMSSSPPSLTQLNLNQQNQQEQQPDPLTQRGLPTPLILGSGSFTRKQILTEMKIPFLLKVKSINERSIGNRRNGSVDGAKELVLTLARAKADALISSLNQRNNEEMQSDQPYDSGNERQQRSNQHASDVMDKNCMVLPTKHDNKGWVILTADQVVTHENKILEKPRDVAQAKTYVQSYAISPPSTVGAVVLTHIPSGISVEGVDTAQIRFKPSVAEGREHPDGSDLVNRLLELNEPILSCAGGLMVEHELVKEHIEGIDGTEDSVMGLSKDLVLSLMVELGNKLRKDTGTNKDSAAKNDIQD